MGNFKKVEAQMLGLAPEVDAIVKAIQGDQHGKH